MAGALILSERPRNWTAVGSATFLQLLEFGSCGGWRSIFSNGKDDLNTRFFFVLNAHHTVVFVVIMVFEESDPLRVGGNAAVENNVLRNGD